MATKTRPTYNKSKIADLYGISLKSLNAWFEDEDFQKEFGLYRGKVFSPKQVAVIEKHFGTFDGFQYEMKM